MINISDKIKKLTLYFNFMFSDFNHNIICLLLLYKRSRLILTSQEHMNAPSFISFLAVIDMFYNSNPSSLQ